MLNNIVKPRMSLPVSQMTTRVKSKRYLLIAPILKDFDLEQAAVVFNASVNCLDIPTDIITLRNLLWKSKHHLMETNKPDIFRAVLVFGEVTYEYTVMQVGENRTVINL